MKTKTKKRVRYMHLIDRLPAQYWPDQQICFAGKRVTRFATSLKQIRKEQKKSKAWRKRSLGIRGDEDIFSYGYIRIEL